MALDFNPFRRSGTQSGANVGFSDVLNANKGVSDAIAGIGAGIQDIRNVAGDKAVSDLLASGQLQGLDDTTALARIQQASGGNISPAMEKNLSTLMQSRGVDKQISARAEESQLQRDFTADENALNRIQQAEIQRANQDFTKAENNKNRESQKIMLDTKLTAQQKESELDRIAKQENLKATLANQIDTANIAQYGQNIRQETDIKARKEMQETKLKNDLAIAKARANNKPSLLSKLGVERIDDKTLENISETTVKNVLGTKLGFGDWTPDDKTRLALQTKVVQVLSTDEGLNAMAIGGEEAVADLILRDFNKMGITMAPDVSVPRIIFGSPVFGDVDVALQAN